MPPTATPPLVARTKVEFPSGDELCVAWHYPGTTGASVIMAGGGAVTKESGTDRFATLFHAAGFTVLAFDYRRLGESGGQPRPNGPLGRQPGGWRRPRPFPRSPPGRGP